MAHRRLRDEGLPVAGGEPFVHLDGLLHAAVALQLDAPVLPGALRPGAQWWVPAASSHLNYTDADFEAVADRFVAAARLCSKKRWWSACVDEPSIKRRILREIIVPRFRRSRRPFPSGRTT